MYINGVEYKLTGSFTLAEWVESNVKEPARCAAAEYNGKILQRNQFDRVILKDNDVIELVNFVGGG